MQDWKCDLTGQLSLLVTFFAGRAGAVPGPLRAGRSRRAVERVVAPTAVDDVPVLALWAATVVIALPPLFGFG